jgi:acetylornithine/succinyldiaminopimelate/putrescine aminotransferase
MNMNGYTDLQVNGYAGVDFNDSKINSDQIHVAARRLRDDGATHVLATVITSPPDRMAAALAPRPDDYRVFLLSTGSEATENCIKLAKTYALEKYGPERKYIVSFQNAFHGRTLGAQLAGGISALKNWLTCNCPQFVQVPFPDGYRTTDTSFELFLSSLKEKGVQPQQIAGVISAGLRGSGRRGRDGQQQRGFLHQ